MIGHNPHPKTCAYLESIGINPYLVAAEPIGPDGYFTFARDGDGKAIPDPLFENETKKDFHPWPSAEVWRTVEFWLAEDRMQYGWVKPIGGVS